MRTSPERDALNVAAFRQGLRRPAMSRAENVAIEYRWAEGDYDRLAGAGGRLG